jgi:hypothetical protein
MPPDTKLHYSKVKIDDNGNVIAMGGLLAKNELGCCEGAIFTNMTTKELCVRINGTSEIISNSSLNRCSLRKSADQILTSSGIWYDINFDVEKFDKGNIHDNITNNEQIQVQSGHLYLVTYQIEVDSVKVRNQIRIMNNATPMMISSPNPDLQPAIKYPITIEQTALLQFETGFIKLQVSSDSNNSVVKKDNTYIMLMRIF